jgi:hypothetical protein
MNRHNTLRAPLTYITYLNCKKTLIYIHCTLLHNSFDCLQSLSYIQSLQFLRKLSHMKWQLNGYHFYEETPLTNVTQGHEINTKSLIIWHPASRKLHDRMLLYRAGILTSRVVEPIVHTRTWKGRWSGSTFPYFSCLWTDRMLSNFCKCIRFYICVQLRDQELATARNAWRNS